VVRKTPRTAFYFIQSAMTGFTASAFLSRNRASLKEAFEGLELCEGKLSCTVLRGLDGSNPVRLLGYRQLRSPGSAIKAACRSPFAEVVPGAPRHHAVGCRVHKRQRENVAPDESG
jgi:hypothetical protein